VSFEHENVDTSLGEQETEHEPARPPAHDARAGLRLHDG
jgi:hypothetical protein